MKETLKGWKEAIMENIGENDYIEEFYKETLELVERTGDRDDYDVKEKEKVMENVLDTIMAMNKAVRKEVEKAKNEVKVEDEIEDEPPTR